MNKNRSLKIYGNVWIQRGIILFVLLLIMAVFQRAFFSWNNVKSILLSISIYGVMSCGMLLAMLVGGIDLSMGSTAALTSVIALYTYNSLGCTTQSCLLGILLALVAACIVGSVHGICDAYFRLPTFVVTLATSNLLYGLSSALLNNKYVHLANTSGLYYKIGNSKLFMIPMPIVIFIVIAVIIGLIMFKTTYGKRVYAVGSNSTASNIVGINSRLFKLSCYVVCSITACIGGIVLSSMNMVTSSITAQGYESMVMLALVVGGTDIMGGSGDIGGAVFGALLAGIIDNMIVLLNVDTNYSKAVQGVIIVIAVAFNVYSTRKSSGLIAARKSRLAKKSGTGDAL